MMHLFFLAVLVAPALLMARAATTTWTTAAEMRAKMEEIVLEQAKYVEDEYKGIFAEEGANCNHQLACSQTKSDWASAKWDTSFLTHNTTDDPETCLRIDKTATDVTVTTPFTGRDVGGRTSQCKVGGRNTNTFEGWAPIKYEGGKWVKNDVSKAQYFLTNKCTQSNTKGTCTVDVDKYGVNFPDGSKGDADKQAHAEICITNQLKPKFQQWHAQYPQISWQFLGMQKSGLYRNWPAIAQCRTENQCSVRHTYIYLFNLVTLDLCIGVCGGSKVVHGHYEGRKRVCKGTSSPSMAR